MWAPAAAESNGNLQQYENIFQDINVEKSMVRSESAINYAMVCKRLERSFPPHFPE